MNPLQELKSILTNTTDNISGTVVGMQGTLVQLRTPKGIRLVNTTTFCAQGSTVTLDNTGKVVTVLDSEEVIPTYRV